MATTLAVPVPGGHVAAIDYGGHGPGVLLVHGTGQNAMAWQDVAQGIVERSHPVAVDLRGHGQSSADSADPEQYWRDLALVVQELGWLRPLLVGHSTGAYAVTAAVAAGRLDPAAVCLVDGFVLDNRETAAAQHVAMRAPAALEQLRRDFGYGWVGDEQEMHDFVARCVRDAEHDWLNAGARPELVEQVTHRSFVRRGRRWVRRPLIEEIVTVSAPEPEADVFPSVDVYARLRCRGAFVLAAGGLYAERRDEVVALTAADPGRRLVELDANHNVPMTRPAALADIIVDLLA